MRTITTLTRFDDRYANQGYRENYDVLFESNYPIEKYNKVKRKLEKAYWYNTMEEHLVFDDFTVLQTYYYQGYKENRKLKLMLSYTIYY